MDGALFTEPLGNFEPVYAMNPGKMAGDELGLIGLNRADEMPGDIVSPELLLLGPRFLSIAFREMALAGKIGEDNVRRRFSFTDGK